MVAIQKWPGFEGRGVGGYLQLDDLAELTEGEGLEGDELVHAVDELRPEHPLHRAHHARLAARRALRPVALLPPRPRPLSGNRRFQARVGVQEVSWLKPQQCKNIDAYYAMPFAFHGRRAVL